MGQVKLLVKKQLHVFFMPLVLEIEPVNNLSKKVQAAQDGFKKK